MSPHSAADEMRTNPADHHRRSEITLPRRGKPPHSLGCPTLGCNALPCGQDHMTSTRQSKCGMGPPGGPALSGQPRFQVRSTGLGVVTV